MALDIYAEETRVGVIETGREGPALVYDPAWTASRDAFPVSLSMPLTALRWGEETITPWLQNLLPEGEPLRAMTRAVGVAQDDILGLVSRTGGDLAGGLSIGQPRPAARAGRYGPIGDEAALEEIIERLPAKPFLAGEDGVSMSLAGAQEKLPVALRDGALAIPLDGAPSTHILKPDNPRLPGSVSNEALCMTLARRCGLPTAPVTTGSAGARSYLLVERYDRTVRDGSVARRHQEDFCQALGRPPGAKYETNRIGRPGPSLAEMFALTRERMTAQDILRLLDAVIFNIAVGNVDSHAKNYSILIASNAVTLAPLYDLMSGLAWDGVTQNHAQSIGGARRGRHVLGRHWRSLAAACGLAGPATVRRVQALTDRILKALPEAVEAVDAMPAGPGPMLKVFADAIAERAALVGANAAVLQGGPPDQETDAEDPPAEAFGGT